MYAARFCAFHPRPEIHRYTVIKLRPNVSGSSGVKSDIPPRIQSCPTDTPFIYFQPSCSFFVNVRLEDCRKLVIENTGMLGYKIDHLWEGAFYWGGLLLWEGLGNSAEKGYRSQAPRIGSVGVIVAQGSISLQRILLPSGV